MLRTGIAGWMMGASEQGAGGGRWEVSPRTLIFVLNGGDVLLMKRGPHKRILPNRYNGVGGHVERGEDVYSSALREVEEESAEGRDLRLRGVHHIDPGRRTHHCLHLYGGQRLAHADRRRRRALKWVDRARIAALDLVETCRRYAARLAMPERCTAVLRACELRRVRYHPNSLW